MSKLIFIRIRDDNWDYTYIRLGIKNENCIIPRKQIVVNDEGFRIGVCTCGESLLQSMERCPKCNRKIDWGMEEIVSFAIKHQVGSMTFYTCPTCGNELDAAYNYCLNCEAPYKVKL